MTNDHASHRPQDEDRYLVTERIDYSQTGPVSVWGPGDKDTLEYLDKTEMHGTWLNLAAGDGRYNNILLKKTDHVTAADLDENALAKLVANTPESLKPKLTTAVFDSTEPFPYADGTFDGVFCTGFLHLFPTDILRKIVAEMDRVLRPHGRIILDFSADLLRELPDGRFYTKESEPLYSIEEAIALMKQLFADYQVLMIRSRVPREEIKTLRMTYMFSCRFVIVQADKP